MGLLEQSQGLLPATANPKMLAQALKARQQPRKQLNGQGLLDTAAIGLSPIPVIGDLLGLGADANRFINEPESRTPMNFGLAALGLIPFVPPLVSAGLGKFAQSQGKQLASLPTGPARNQAGAIVYHGSPHKFDAFDSSKIGTGEGAQAYGHGLYFAENPSVASTYTGGGGDVYGMSVKRDNGKYHAAAFSHSDPKFRKESYFDSEADANKWISEQSGGSIYKVDLPDEAIAKMLDYDAPINKQSPEVLRMLENAGINTQSSALAGTMLKGQESHLAKFGIPGTRYLDGNSRSPWIIDGKPFPPNAEKATSNFVVFPGNEGLLKILERQ